MSDASEAQLAIDEKIGQAVKDFNELLKQAKDAGLKVTVTFPLEPDEAVLSVDVAAE